MVVVAGLGICAALADAKSEGPRGSFGLPVLTDEEDQQCIWEPTYSLAASSLQTATTGGAAQGVAEVGAHGMEIYGYGHLYTDKADEPNASKTLSKSTSSFGFVTVKRTRAAPNHEPRMILDWFPRFQAEAKVTDPDADCSAAGMMKGDAAGFGAHVLAKGGASADGKAHDQGIKVSLGGLEVALSSSSEDDNTDAPIDNYHAEKTLDQDTASFSCNVTMKVHVPADGVFDFTEECEAWIWDSFPELDLHGYCPQCRAFAYGTYGWTL
jgi:hypothetical protein